MCPSAGLRKDGKRSSATVTAYLRIWGTLSFAVVLRARPRNPSLAERGSAGGALATLGERCRPASPPLPPPVGVGVGVEMGSDCYAATTYANVILRLRRLDSPVA